MTGSTLTGNSASKLNPFGQDGGGGAIHSGGGTLVVKNSARSSTIRHPTVPAAPIQVFNYYSPGSLTVQELQAFTGNGAVSEERSRTALRPCRCRTAPFSTSNYGISHDFGIGSFGGAIGQRNPRTGPVSNCTFTGNHAGFGGAVNNAFFGASSGLALSNSTSLTGNVGRATDREAAIFDVSGGLHNGRDRSPIARSTGTPGLW